MAKRLGVSKWEYEIRESPQDFVPEPLPNHLADRLNAIDQERIAAGQVLKMPEAHCRLHECKLRQNRGDWLPPLRGKMKRWWAVCPIGGELYTVRSDGQMRNAPRVSVPIRRKT
jgi:hypothetical protein